MTNKEIAEQAALEYTSLKKTSPNKSEQVIVRYILSTRYKWVKVSEEFDKLAILNLPSVSTFFDLMATLIKIELEENDTYELNYKILSATLHLRNNGYFKSINSPDLNLIHDCLANIDKYLSSKYSDKVEFTKHYILNFSTLIISKKYREFKSYDEIESFLDMLD